MGGADPRDFEKFYGEPLQIYRSFNNKSNRSITRSAEAEWVEEGGIVFYSLQIEYPWSDWRACPEDEGERAADDARVGTQGEGGRVSECGGKDAEIRKYAKAIKAVAPAQVMVPVGYEPDLYTPEANGVGASKNKGTVEDYQAAWSNFARIFAEEEVDNVSWVMDFSWNIRERLHTIDELMPRDVPIDWLFFNLFQFQSPSSGPTGRCGEGFDQIYSYLRDEAGRREEYAEMAWGLGAWGIINYSWIKDRDQEECLTQVQERLEDRENYPQIQASIYFNSLTSRIAPNQLSQHEEAFERLLHSDVFYREGDGAALAQTEMSGEEVLAQ